MPRITLAAEQFAAGRGGIARVARLVARALAWEVRGGRLEARCISLNDLQPPDDFDLPIALCGGSRAKFVTRVWAASRWATHLVFDFPGMARARCYLPGLRRPYLTFAHGIELWESARPDRLRAARDAALLLFDTEFARRRVSELHGPFPNSMVCWLATEEDDAPAPAPEVPSGPPTALIVGRLDEQPWKGHHALIDAWPRVRTAVPQARLLVVGEGPGLANAQARAAASAAGDAIEFRGFVPEPEIEAVWRAAHVFAMPAVAEGFGLVYVEAMRYGLPVIASVHDSGQEVNVDGVTGFNVNLSHPAELAERLARLLSAPSHATELGRQGVERWRRHFRYSSFRDRFLTLLGRLVAQFPVRG